MVKAIYALHHGERELGPDPIHGERGREELHVLRRILQSLFMSESQTLPMPPVEYVAHGTGRRFKEMAEALLQSEEFKRAQVLPPEFLLGTEDAVYAVEEKEYVLHGDGTVSPREECTLISDIPGVYEKAWLLVEEIYGKMSSNSSAFFCTGRQFLLALGMSPEKIHLGAVFKINVESRKVDRKIGY